ncbi:F-box domain-containing protein [Caenorhabditis elegans]|uniref:F-box domain-containing protein n=1 Tax=Caenorhabditis elegans TaxID=6239 RepID=Q95XB2_CAEEL|nr:F-box domain-containing protein [Caenorhabditis elegans]CCD73890.2 F-box domain-containing protein [Caenorhabditis elegans]
MPNCFVSILTKWFTKPPTTSHLESPLLNMPLDIVNQVFEKLSPMDLWTCRNVCQSLRRAVDGFGIYFPKISLQIYTDNICIALEDYIYYCKAASSGGTSVTYKKREGRVKGKNYIKVAFKDFEILLKHSTELHISIYIEDIKYTVKFLMDILKAQKCAHIKKIEFSILPLIW